MPTGACGVNCDACGLNHSGVCSSCGPGTSGQGRKKMSAQKRLLGSVCPVLACAEANGVDYCLRDCVRFPCHAFQSGPYPFSQGFLMMQERRRSERSSLQAASGNRVKVPSAHWEDLGKADPDRVCRNAGARPHTPHGFILPFLGGHLLVDPSGRTISRQAENGWERIENSLLELVSLVYLITAGPLTRNGRDGQRSGASNGPFFYRPPCDPNAAPCGSVRPRLGGLQSRGGKTGRPIHGHGGCRLQAFSLPKGAAPLPALERGR